MARCNMEPAESGFHARAVPDRPVGPVLAQIAKRHLGSRKSLYNNDLDVVSQMAQIVSQKDLQRAEEEQMPATGCREPVAPVNLRRSLQLAGPSGPSGPVGPAPTLWGARCGSSKRHRTPSIDYCWLLFCKGALTPRRNTGYTERRHQLPTMPLRPDRNEFEWTC